MTADSGTSSRLAGGLGEWAADLRASGWLAPVRTAGATLLTMVVVNACFNSQLAGLSWRLILPSRDGTLLLGAYALYSLLKRPAPNWVHHLVFPVLLLSLLLRTADGIENQYFHRLFNVALDLHLIPEGVRLLIQTVPLAEFVGLAALGILGTALVVFLLYYTSRTAWLTLRTSTGRVVFILGTIGYVLFSVGPPWNGATLAVSSVEKLFGGSIWERFAHEADFALHVAGYKQDKVQDMAEVRAALETQPNDLKKLGKSNVLLFFIESYGYTSFEHKQQYEWLNPTLQRTERRLRGLGFDMISNYMDSPTYGAGSQFAHSTFASGIRIENNFQYRLVLASDAPAMPRFFKRAGYRAVAAIPGTRRPWPAGEFYGFDKMYDRWAYDYSGPVVGWGELPDQYVVDFMRRKELKLASGPIFAQFILVTSHGPWTSTPPLLDDWDRVGDGTVYGRARIRRFRTSWSQLEDAPRAYSSAVAYDFKVIASYLEQFVDDDTLVIVLGDHQPVVAVSGRGHPHSVPVHVISRSEAHLQQFVKRGFTPGLTPRQALPHVPMEDFLKNFLADFSEDVWTPPK